MTARRPTAAGRPLVWGVILVVVLQGCAPGRVIGDLPLSDGQLAEAVAAYPDRLHPWARVLALEGERNAVLNHARLGVLALELGSDALAARELDRALEGIEAVYADTPHALEARSLWISEEVKDFKGEPYERAMVYYYRGLLYLRAGDYQNARASFLGGAFQDTIAEREEARGDLALLTFLAGWASQCDGDRDQANAYYDRAMDAAHWEYRPAAADRLLVLAELGSAPEKTALGPYHELLAFVERPADEDAVPMVVSGGSLRGLSAGEDLWWQATSRGGRKFDYIQEGKAQFRAGAEGAGEVMEQAASTVGLMSDMAAANTETVSTGALIAELALIVGGGLAKIFAAATKTGADLRTLDVIPGLVRLVTLPAADSGVSLQLRGRGEHSLDVVAGGACSLARWRDHSPLELHSRAPNSIPGIAGALHDTGTLARYLARLEVERGKSPVGYGVPVGVPPLSWKVGTGDDGVYEIEGYDGDDQLRLSCVLGREPDAERDTCPFY